jgi:cysteine-rich repeat protein
VAGSRRVAALALLAASACSDTTGVEVVVDYPTSVSKLEIASTQFEARQFDLESRPGEVVRLSGTVVILLSDALATTPLPLSLVATGDASNVRLELELEAEPKISELVSVDARLIGCGDAEMQSNETCDDGNANDGDGCNSACIVEGGCGDGIVDPEELCDDRNLTTGDGCDVLCTIEMGWKCIGTPSVCTRPCGDGTIGARETCDDSNAIAGDGCSADCNVEAGFGCFGTPSECLRCGGRTLDPGETCDDGARIAGDGCDGACAVEAGFACEGEPSACASICGDGLIRDEACDDGNERDGDGCASDCTLEFGCACDGEPSLCGCCGNGRLEPVETCDDANVGAGDGCDGACAIEPGFGCIEYGPSFCYADDNVTFVDGASASCPGEGTRAMPFCVLQDGVGGAHEDVVVFASAYAEVVAISNAPRRLFAHEGVSIQGLVIDGTRVLVRNATVASPSGTSISVSGAGGMAELIDLELGGDISVLSSDGASVDLLRCNVRALTRGVNVLQVGSSGAIHESTIVSGDRGVVVEGGASATVENSSVHATDRALNARDTGSTMMVDGSTITSDAVGARTEQISTLTIRRSRISAAQQGMLVSDGEIILEDSRVSTGLAAGMTTGAGHMLTIRRSELVSSAGFGLFLDDGTVVVEDSRIRGMSGGVNVVKANADLTVLTSSIGPSAGYGITIDDGDLRVDRSHIFRNSTGGLWLGTAKGVSITNSVIVANGSATSATGGARYQTLPVPTVFAGNTIAHNQSNTGEAGVDCANINAPLSNVIAWGNVGPQTVVGVSGNCAPSSSNLQALRPDNISADPRFVSPATGDYHLRAGSVCIDAGDDALVPPGITADLDGEARISGASVDIGADEVQ